MYVGIVAVRIGFPICEFGVLAELPALRFPKSRVILVGDVSPSCLFMIGVDDLCVPSLLLFATLIMGDNGL